MSTSRRTFLKTTTGLSALAITPSAHSLIFKPLSAEISVAVIGLGRQGRAIVAEFQKIDGVTVAAVCDTDTRRLELGARRARGAKSFATHTELLPSNGTSLETMVRSFERELIVDCLKNERGNCSAAARALGTTQRKLSYRVKNLGINPKNYKR